jgi:hypothetical protein
MVELSSLCSKAFEHVKDLTFLHDFRVITPWADIKLFPLCLKDEKLTVLSGCVRRQPGLLSRIPGIGPCRIGPTYSDQEAVELFSFRLIQKLIPLQSIIIGRRFLDFLMWNIPVCYSPPPYKQYQEYHSE